MKEMLDLSKNPVIDSHCHAFLPDKETKPFEQYLTLSDLNVPKEDMVNTFIYRQVVRELSRVLNFNGNSEEIVNERQKRYKQDPVGYIKLLFDDANIEMLLIDTGYPYKDFTGYSIALNDFSKLVPCEVREIFRIDNVLFALMENHVSFDNAVEQFNEQVKNSVKNGAVGLKSVIAYSTGLEIKRNAIENVRNAYNNFIGEVKSGKSIRQTLFTGSERAKVLMDYFVLLGLESSVKLNVPFQIHVGIGDAPILDLRISNPILLHDIITDEALKNSKIVLTHGGYPYIEEAGFLVNSYPNVFLDLSETIPFISIGIKDKLLNLLEMAPTNKIMYGSDGYNIPELFWIGAIKTKKALSSALTQLLELNEIDEEQAYNIAKQFLFENTKRIYKL